MTVQPQPQEVKRIVARTFLELGLESPSLFGLKERSQAGHLAASARSYYAGGFRAVWRIEAGLLDFYTPDDRLILTINLMQERVHQAMAA